MNTVEQHKQEKHPLDVIEDVYDYAEGELTDEEIEERAGGGEWERLKWAGMYSQKQDDYFMIRTKVPGGYLTPDQAEVIGEVTDDLAVAPEEYGGEEQNELWGDAYLDITTRQDIQKHWIRVEDVPEMWERYDEVGLTTIQGCGDSARNVLGCPAAGLDDHECFNAQPVIDAVSDYFTENREYANLPRKFKITITGCKHDCAQSQINDLGLVPAQKEIGGEHYYGFHARVGGGLSDGPRMLGTRCLHPARTCRRVLSLCRPDVQGTRRPAQPRGLPHALSRRADGSREVRGSHPRPLYRRSARTRRGSDGRLQGRPRRRPRPETGRPEIRRFNVIAGRMGGDEFAEAARAAKKYGTEDASVRLATDQNFLISHIPEENVEDLLAEPFAQEYQPIPVRSPAVQSAVRATSSVTTRSSRPRNEPSAGSRTRQANRHARRSRGRPDAHVRLFRVVCTATDRGYRLPWRDSQTRRRRGPGRYSGTQRGGRQSRRRMDFGLGGALGTDNEFLDWVQTAVPAHAVIPALEKLFDAYSDDRNDDERFYAWCRRVDNERLRTIMQGAEAPVAGGVAHGD